MAKLFLCQGVGLRRAQHLSPTLFKFFRNNLLDITDETWDGQIESLPVSEAVIVRADPMNPFTTRRELRTFCELHGHLCYYDDRLIGTEGRICRKEEDLIEAARLFLRYKFGIRDLEEELS